MKEISETKAKISRSAYQANYRRKELKTVTVILNRYHDADIIAKLETVKSKSGYIKRLIRSDIKKN